MEKRRSLKEIVIARRTKKVRTNILEFALEELADETKITMKELHRDIRTGMLDPKNLHSVRRYRISEAEETAPKRKTNSDTLKDLGVTPNAAKIHKQIIEKEKPKKKVFIPVGADPKTYDSDNNYDV